MTSIIKFQALSGALEESPHCYLLQVDEFTFLLDCGWDEQCNIELIKEIKKYIHQVDAVLLSYPDCLHIGSLPYLIGKLGLSCPIYSTIPVYKMGQMFMYDLYQSRHNIENFELFTLDDVDAAFDKIIQLKYNQSVALKGKGYGLTITPLPAGHMIGGTIWKIVKDGEEDILYAVDFNHKKERHLNGCVLESHSRPSLLITDALNATYNQSRRRNRDEQLMTNILQTLRNNGNVLIAVDTAGRVLELAHMVDQLWRNQESGLMAYSLALLNNVSYNVVEFAKSQIEWMSDKLMRSFEGARNNPFQFKHLQLCHSLQELAKVPSPKVVLASMPDMECGFSRDLFLQWCQSRKNSIVFTSRTSPGTLARNLIDNPSNRTITLQVKHRVKLEGMELEEHLKKEREKELLNQKQKAKYEVEDMASSEDSEDELDMIVSGKPKHDLLIKSEGKGQMTFFKTYKKAYPMYPFLEERIKCDDYGEIIKIEDYLIKENTIEMEESIDKTEVKEEEFQDVEIPTKCISHSQTFHIQAQIQYIDFEGRSDGESIRKIISQLKPRRLIIVRGSPESSAYLSNYCSSGISEKVFMPKVHEIIDATTESHIYQVKLKDYLVSSLKFSKGKEADVAWVDGMLSRKREEKTDRTVNSSEDSMEVEEEMKDLIPTLEPISLHEVTGHKSCFINDLKLSDFKQILTKLGIPSEFSAGILWCCNGTVALRRHDAGRITMEGCLSDDYYKVRQLLYDQYAVV